VDAARDPRDAPDADHAGPVVGSERFGHGFGRPPQRPGERHRVFEGEARALREDRRDPVGGVTHEDQAAVADALVQARRQRPHVPDGLLRQLPRPGRGDELPDRVGPVGEPPVDELMLDLRGFGAHPAGHGGPPAGPGVAEVAVAEAAAVGPVDLDRVGDAFGGAVSGDDAAEDHHSSIHCG